MKKYLHLILFIAGFLLFNLNNSHAQINLNNGLSLYLPFNGNTNDESGNGNNGIAVNGPLLTSDRFGNVNSAYLFDGVNDYIRISDGQGKLSTTPFSIVLWFQPLTNQFKILVGKREYGTTNGQQYQLSVFRSNPRGLFSGITSEKLDCSGNLSDDVLSMTNYTPNLCLNRWYCVIITFDGITHKMFLDGTLVSEDTPDFTKMMQCPSDIRLGNWWSGDPLTFNGKLDDFRWYSRVLTNDEIGVLSAGDFPFTQSEFQFSKDLCNPLTHTFNGSSTTQTTFKWDFGDGTAVQSGVNLVHNFPAEGEYVVKMIAGSGSCTDTIQKTIEIRIVDEAIIATKDTIICAGSEITLRADSATQYCWGPSSQIGTGSEREVKVSPTQKTTYVLNALKLGSNLIANGNFELGNTGFTSEFTFANPNTATGQYFIGKNPSQWNSNFCTFCGDNTLGGGNIMLVNGPLTTSTKLWISSAAISPNTQYYFSFRVYSFNGDQLPSFVANINNAIVGKFNLTARGKWVQIGFYWYSGSNTTANIFITNANTSTLLGNDFGLDDFSLSTYKFAKDQVTVDINNTVSLKASPDSAICPGESIPLTVTGSSQISWNPASGLSNANITNPVASPLVTTTYIVTDLSPGGCTSKDTVLVTVKSAPVITMSKDTIFCSGQPGNSGIALSASGGVSYNWFPATGLNNASLATPIASPVTTTDYRVSVTGSNGCKDTGTVKISVNPFVAVKAEDVAPTCIGNAVTLQASGAGDYSWFPSTGLSGTNIAAPIANPTQTTSYIVFSPGAGVCSGRDTAVVIINPLPAITLSPGDTTLCIGKSLLLTAGGGTQYQWTPATGLDNPSSPNPTASPAITTTYSVSVTDANGCSDTKQTQIIVGTTVNLSAVGDAPICAGNSVSINASGSADYKWFPATGLSADNIPNPIASPAQTTTYYVVSPSAGVCSNIDSVTISVSPLPVVSITPPETLICNGGQVQLNATGGSIYSWSPSTGLSNPSSASPTANPTVTTTYNLLVKDDNGCEATEQAKIIVAPGSKIFVPNAFTPNGDGLNDCIGIKGAIGATTFEFAIFNRWGERVFYAKDPTQCWDGVYKGVVQPNGNFAYYLKVSSDCGVVNDKGLITLIR